jgi:hypothetical protein
MTPVNRFGKGQRRERFGDKDLVHLGKPVYRPSGLSRYTIQDGTMLALLVDEVLRLREQLASAPTSGEWTKEVDTTARAVMDETGHDAR